MERGLSFNNQRLNIRFRSRKSFIVASSKFNKNVRTLSFYCHERSEYLGNFRFRNLYVKSGTKRGSWPGRIIELEFEREPLSNWWNFPCTHLQFKLRIFSCRILWTPKKELTARGPSRAFMLFQTREGRLSCENYSIRTLKLILSTH